jgi:hypothetical protein
MALKFDHECDQSLFCFSTRKLIYSFCSEFLLTQYYGNLKFDDSTFFKAIIYYEYNNAVHRAATTVLKLFA